MLAQSYYVTQETLTTPPHLWTARRHHAQRKNSSPPQPASSSTGKAAHPTPSTKPSTTSSTYPVHASQPATATGSGTKPSTTDRCTDGQRQPRHERWMGTQGVLNLRPTHPCQQRPSTLVPPRPRPTDPGLRLAHAMSPRDHGEGAPQPMTPTITDIALVVIAVVSVI